MQGDVIRGFQAWAALYTDAPGIDPPLSWSRDDGSAEDRAAEMLTDPRMLLDLVDELIFDRMSGRADGDGSEPQREDGTFDPDAPASNLLVAMLFECAKHGEASRLELSKRLAALAEEKAQED